MDQAQADETILWDVIDEHLDEAGFCFTQWERGLYSPLYRLEQLGRTIERRLLAHVDGLVVGGEAVARRVLVPALFGDDPTQALVAALALLFSEEQRGAAAVVEALVPSNQMLPALIRALQLVPLDRRIQAYLQPLLRSPHGSLRAAGMDVLSFHRVDLGEDLPTLMSDSDPIVQQTALWAASRCAPRRPVQEALRRLFRTGADVSGLIEAGMVAGVPEAEAVCRRLLRQGSGVGPKSAGLITSTLGGILGALLREDGADWLRGGLADPAQQRAALFAAGFAGSVQLVEPILQLMRAPELAALAGEALSGITGADIEKDKLDRQASKDPGAQDKGADEPGDLADLPDPDLDLSLRHEDELPVPDPDAAAAWWGAHRGNFDPRRRYVHGLPFSGEETLLQALALAPMRRRHALALELAIRSHGELAVETQTLSSQQLRFLPARWQTVAEVRQQGAR